MTAARSPTDPLRVVIIDDTADLRELLRLALVRGGMRVVGEAGDGQAGIDLVAESEPDVVLLDLSMPVMDGLTALPHLRACAPAARIIVLSGFGATQMAQRALQIGADGYLQKGASLTTILETIHQIADRPPVPPAPEVRALPRAELALGIRTPDAGALALAPFAVVEVSADAPYEVLALNPAARTLLADALSVGSTLAEADPGLATALTESGSTRLPGPADGFDSAVSSNLGGVPAQVTVRQGGSTLFLYLRSTTEGESLLRTAIATTAHEIRGPVAVLCAVAETIANDGSDGLADLDEEQRTALMASVGRQARMLDSITADLLTVAQIQRGMVRVDARIVPTAIAVASVIQDRYPDSVTLEVEDHRPVRADPVRLHQMLGNLLTNAHKYGEPPVVVRIRTSLDDSALLCIDVEDNGPGVPDEFRHRLFHEFSRAFPTSGSGTGLGLHVVHTLARAHGGSASYAPGRDRGSVFTVCLPVAIENP